MSKTLVLFAHTYFLLLTLTAVIVTVNLFLGQSFVFYLPFIIGGVGSLILYFIKAHTLKMRAKVLCHACCASIYIIGAFLLLVFYNIDFFASWSFHIWIIPVLIIAAGANKDFWFILLLLSGIFISLFVLDFGGLLGQVVTAIGMGSFWGFSFYFLLVFLHDILEENYEVV